MSQSNATLAKVNRTADSIIAEAVEAYRAVFLRYNYNDGSDAAQAVLKASTPSEQQALESRLVALGYPKRHAIEPLRQRLVALVMDAVFGAELEPVPPISGGSPEDTAAKFAPEAIAILEAYQAARKATPKDEVIDSIARSFRSSVAHAVASYRPDATYAETPRYQWVMMTPTDRDRLNRFLDLMGFDRVWHEDDNEIEPDSWRFERFIESCVTGSPILTITPSPDPERNDDERSDGPADREDVRRLPALRAMRMADLDYGGGNPVRLEPVAIQAEGRTILIKSQPYTVAAGPVGVELTSPEGVVHYVIDGECSCPSYHFRNAADPAYACKHILAAREAKLIPTSTEGDDDEQAVEATSIHDRRIGLPPDQVPAAGTLVAIGVQLGGSCDPHRLPAGECRVGGVLARGLRCGIDGRRADRLHGQIRRAEVVEGSGQGRYASLGLISLPSLDLTAFATYPEPTMHDLDILPVCGGSPEDDPRDDDPGSREEWEAHEAWEAAQNSHDHPENVALDLLILSAFSPKLAKAIDDALPPPPAVPATPAPALPVEPTPNAPRAAGGLERAILALSEGDPCGELRKIATILRYDGSDDQATTADAIADALRTALGALREAEAEMAAMRTRSFEELMEIDRLKDACFVAKHAILTHNRNSHDGGSDGHLWNALAKLRDVVPDEG